MPLLPTPIPNPSVSTGDVANDLTTNIATKVLSAAQGVVLNAADIASGAIVGTNLEITLKGGAKVNVDVTSLLTDIRLQSGVYNPATKAIDFTIQDAVGGNVSTVSVPVNALLPVTLDAQSSLVGDGATAGLKLDGDAAAPGADMVYGSDGTGVKGWKADPALQAIFDKAGVPATGSFYIGLVDGVVTLFGPV